MFLPPEACLAAALSPCLQRPENYPGHLRERGWNWLQFWDQYHCWVRNVQVFNADFAIKINADFATLENIELGTDFDRAAWSPTLTMNCTG